MTSATLAAPALAIPARFLAGLATGFPLWWFGAPLILFPLHALLLRGMLAPIEGGMIAGIEADHALLLIQTNFLAPDTASSLLGSQLEIRYFTLGLPLAWACAVAIVPSRVLPRALLFVSLVTLAAHALVLALQVGVAVPRLAIRQGADALLVAGLGGSHRLPWSPPPSWLLAAVDHLRITLVHGNLFILPAALAAWARLDALRPAAPVAPAPAARPERKGTRRSKPSRRGG